MNQEQKVDKSLNGILSKARVGNGFFPAEVALIAGTTDFEEATAF